MRSRVPAYCRLNLCDRFTHLRIFTSICVGPRVPCRARMSRSWLPYGRIWCNSARDSASRQPTYSPLVTSATSVSLARSLLPKSVRREFRAKALPRLSESYAMSTNMECSAESSEYSPASVIMAVSISSGASSIAMPVSSPGTNSTRPVASASHRTLPRAPTLPLPMLLARKGVEPRHSQSPTRTVVHASSVARTEQYALQARLVCATGRSELCRVASSRGAAVSSQQFAGPRHSVATVPLLQFY